MKEYLPIQLPSDLQPINRLKEAGPAALSSAELLSLVLGNGRRGDDLRRAEAMLSANDGIPGLSRLTACQLQRLPGIGPTRAARIQAILELGKRYIAGPTEGRPQIRTPSDVANLLMLEMGLLEKEELRVILLDTKNFVKRMETIYRGSLNAAVVRICEVFTPAVRDNAASVIIVHNHPSSDPTPSPEGVRVTEMLVEAGDLLDVEVIDHLIFGGTRFVSMKERRLGFK